MRRIKLCRKRTLLTLLVLTAFTMMSTQLFLNGSIDMFLAEDISNFKHPLELDFDKVIHDLRKGSPIHVQPINVPPFQFQKAPKCNSVAVLTVIVKSAVCNFFYRHTIRSTWGNVRNIPDKVRVFYHVGITNYTNCYLSLEHEWQLYGDIIQSTFIDSYYNNTYKTIMGLRFIYKHCTNSKYVLYVDDDYYVSISNAITFLRQMEMEKKLQRLWAGYASINATPNRRKWIYSGKWTVTRDEYRYKFYPTFMHGGAYLMSFREVKDFYLVSMYTKFMRFDDVFLGIVARKLNILGLHDPVLFPRPDGIKHFLNANDPRIKLAIATHRFGSANEVREVWNYQNLNTTARIAETP